MSPSFVTIDTNDADVDFNPPATAPSKPGAGRNLLLAPPSIAAHEEKLRDLFTTYDRSVTDVHMLDRLSAGLSALPIDTYDLVLVIADADQQQRPTQARLSRDIYNLLVPSMRSNAKLQFQDGYEQAESREAILAGLVEKNGVFEKIDEEEVVIPLRLGAKKKANGTNGVNGTNGTNGAAGSNRNKSLPAGVSLMGLDDYDDDDELIDEDDLLSAEDLKRPIQLPPECQPKDGQKRRRACKDCTCGLAAKLEAQDKERRAKADQELNVLKLKADDLDEVDFTVKGKTGSCNSCSLGDAFRCADCPYIGLPPFKPGEEVQILNNAVQL